MKIETISFIVLGLLALIAAVCMGIVVMDAARWVDIRYEENQF